ncbi:Ribosomal protein S6 kinase alpha-6 [Smittium mucronatum]|uniref:Ribosomal protein S6 kinase alpha-6 n=1 Tax=Smittium mucronatum TaxID=133383 RepID=A0A1R0H1Q6_9FUNG|nr:Ribosomal protein S6 kinase alpha-6 [Smittium mucronatum]
MIDIPSIGSLNCPNNVNLNTVTDPQFSSSIPKSVPFSQNNSPVNNFLSIEPEILPNSLPLIQDDDINPASNLKIQSSRNSIMSKTKAETLFSLEAPLEKLSQYIIDPSSPPIVAPLSRVDFGIRTSDSTKVVFKTVFDHSLAQKEINMLEKIINAHVPNTLTYIDAFKNSSGHQVFVFPRLNRFNTSNKDLVDISIVTRDLLTTLSCLHSVGIVHLDVNPSNLLSEPGHPNSVTLIDFGLAHCISQKTELPKCGTFGFISPEVISGHSSDGRSDIYSLGIILGTMLLEFIPSVDLRFLGSANVTHETVNLIVDQLDVFLKAYGFDHPIRLIPSHPHISDRVHSSSQNRPNIHPHQFGTNSSNCSLSTTVGYEFHSNTYLHSSDLSDINDDPSISDLYASGFSNNHLTSIIRSDLDHCDSLEYNSRTVSPPFYQSSLARPPSSSFYSIKNSQAYSDSFHHNSRDDNRLSESFSHMRDCSPINISYNNYKDLDIPISVLHAADLLRQLLQESPENRPTATQALSHPLFRYFDDDTSHNLQNVSRNISSVSKQRDMEGENSELLNYFKNTKSTDIHSWSNLVKSRLSPELSYKSGVEYMDVYQTTFMNTNALDY